MSSSKELYKRICSISLLQQMTKTMKLVSVSKLTRLQSLLNSKRKFLDSLSEIQKKVDKFPTFVVSEEPNIDEKTIVIPIGSDKGFCGSFNNNICKTSIKYVKSDTNVMPIGSKLYSFFNRINCKFVDKNINLLKKCTDDNISTVGLELFDMLNDGVYSNIVFIYNKFFSTSIQKVVIEDFKIPPKVLEDIPCAEETSDNSVIFESSASDINSFFTKYIFLYKFFNVIYDSLTSENASRMITMNKASDNSDNLLKVLRTLYNQSRQASITNEIIEISAGAMSLNKK